TSTSSQSEGRATQSGLGSLTLHLVLWCESATVNRSLGNGPSAGLSRLKMASTPSTRANSGHRRTIDKTKRRARRLSGAMASLLSRHMGRKVPQATMEPTVAGHLHVREG